MLCLSVSATDWSHATTATNTIQLPKQPIHILQQLVEHLVVEPTKASSFTILQGPNAKSQVSQLFQILIYNH